MIIQRLYWSKIIVVIILVINIFSCSIKKSVTEFDKGERSNEEYYATFTEATKYALIGNYQNAVGLYKLCIEKYPERSGPYYQLSNIFFSFNETDRAKYYGNKAVKIDDKNKWYLLHLANIYQQESNLDSVIILYEKVVKLTDNPEYRYNLSVFYSNAGDIKKSMKIVKELEYEIPDSREILRLKHLNYSALHMQDSAVYQLERLVELFPSDIENYGLLAEYLSEINRHYEASEIYKKLLSKDPKNGLANFSYGDFLLKQRKKDSAIYYYKKGFRAKEIGIEEKIGVIFNFLYDPLSIKKDTNFIESLLVVLKEEYNKDPRPYTLSAEYYVKKSNYSKALKDLQSAINLDVNSYIVWEQYIMLSNLTGNYNNVIEKYKRAIEKFPKEVNLYIYSGYAFYELKDTESIIEICDKGLGIDDIKKNEKVQLLNLLADSYRWKKENIKSDSIFEEILKIDSENLIIRNNYAYYLAIRGEKLNKALELSKYTIIEEPNTATYLDTYGWILYVSGDVRGALKYIERAIRNGGNKNPEVLDHYGIVLLELNNCKEAIESWNYAIKYSGKSEPYSEKIEDAKKKCK